MVFVFNAEVLAADKPLFDQYVGKIKAVGMEAYTENVKVVRLSSALDRSKVKVELRVRPDSLDHQ
eukprot:2522871-Lingulodinium_polyedra.AAC.1